MSAEQDAAIDEAEGVETVTFVWDEDEWAAPAWDELTGDQETAVRRYAESGLTMNDPALALNFLEQILGPQQFAGLGISGATKASRIKTIAAEIAEPLTEAWGLGKGWTRSTRRLMRTTKR